MAQTKLDLTCPDCGRKVKAAHFMRAATQVVRRTCPGCKQRWQVKLAPLGARPGVFFHEATWTRLTELDGAER